MPKTRAQQNRGIRQEAIREQLAAGGHIQHVIDISNKLQQLKEELDSSEVTRLKAAADIKLKLIDKYLASLQSVESKVTTTNKAPKEMTDAELDERIAAASAGEETEKTGATTLQ